MIRLPQAKLDEYFGGESTSRSTSIAQYPYKASTPSWTRPVVPFDSCETTEPPERMTSQSRDSLEASLHELISKVRTSEAVPCVWGEVVFLLLFKNGIKGAARNTKTLEDVATNFFVYSSDGSSQRETSAFVISKVV